MNHHGTLLTQREPASRRQSHWPRPDEIRERTRRIRREWTTLEYGVRERLAAKRLRELAEQLLPE